MDCPKGFKEARPIEALVLKKCIYGLSQAVWQYNKKAGQILWKMKIEGKDLDHVYTYTHVRRAKFLFPYK